MTIVIILIIVVLCICFIPFIIKENKKIKEELEKSEKERIEKEKERIELEKQKEKEEEDRLNNLIIALNKENKEKLTPITSDIRIPEKEELYLKTENVLWSEMRTNTTRTQEYESEGENMFSGKITTFYYTEKDYKEIIQGNLYLTNKSLIVVSDDEAKTLKLNTIADATLYKNAIKMKRLKGKTVLLEIKKVDDAYTFAFFLDRLLKLTSIELYDEE